MVAQKEKACGSREYGTRNKRVPIMVKAVVAAARYDVVQDVQDYAGELGWIL